MPQRGGRVVIQMPTNVQQGTIHPLIESTIAPGTLVHADEHDVYGRLKELEYRHKKACHGKGEYARDQRGFHKVHVNTIEGFWPLLRIRLRPHRCMPQDPPPLDLTFFQFFHNVRARGMALIGSLVTLLVESPRNSL